MNYILLILIFLLIQLTLQQVSKKTTSTKNDDQVKLPPKPPKFQKPSKVWLIQFRYISFLNLHNQKNFIIFPSTVSQSNKTKISNEPDEFDEDMPISSSIKETPSEKIKKKYLIFFLSLLNFHLLDNKILKKYTSFFGKP